LMAVNSNAAASRDTWLQNLKAGDFHGSLVHTNSTTQDWMLITSSKNVPNSALSASPMEYVVVHEATAFQEDLARQVQETFEKAGLACKTTYVNQLEAAPEGSETTFIFVPEIERPLLEQLSAHDFGKIRDALVTAKGLLWLTNQGTTGLLHPSKAMNVGLTRVLRAENDKAVIVTACLEEAPVDVVLKDVIQLVEITDFSSANQEYESEYVKKNGHFHIGRILESKRMTQELARRSSPYQIKTRKWAAVPPLQMTVETPGLLYSLHFVEDTSMQEALRPTEVEIEVTHVGLNFKDLLLALGRENGRTFGNELQTGRKSLCLLTDCFFYLHATQGRKRGKSSGRH
jgi:hypothetical protein